MLDSPFIFSIWVPLFIKAIQKAGDTPHFPVVVLRDWRPADNPLQENIEQDEEYRPDEHVFHN